jgi:hypothetical protein
MLSWYFGALRYKCESTESKNNLRLRATTKSIMKVNAERLIEVTNNLIADEQLGFTESIQYIVQTLVDENGQTWDLTVKVTRVEKLKKK